MSEYKLFVDIGNTYFHIYDGEKVEHLSHENAIKKYRYTPLQYISVKHQLSNEIEAIDIWQNISSAMSIVGEYKTMGIDRKALCWSHENGIFIDAGSAITVDVMSDGIYQGGFILPGITAYLSTYAAISPALDIVLDKTLDLEVLPCTTKEQISYGIIASIKALVEKHSNGKRVYFAGGDGKFLSTFFDDAIYDEMLVFDGMQKALMSKSIKE